MTFDLYMLGGLFLSLIGAALWIFGQGKKDEQLTVYKDTAAEQAKIINDAAKANVFEAKLRANSDVAERLRLITNPDK